MCDASGSFSLQSPSLLGAVVALLDAELHAMSRSWRAIIWTTAVPILILLLGEAQVPSAARMSPDATLEIAALAVTIGVFALGLFGYATTLATYRERGVFDRLRCAPVPAELLLLARLVAQMAAVVVQAVVVVAVAMLVYHASPSLRDLPALVAVWALGGLCGLALGQAVVAFTRRAAEAVAAARLILITVFLLSGTLVSVHQWPQWLQAVSRWSPVNLLEHLLTRTLLGQGLPWEAFGLRFVVLCVWLVVLSVAGSVFFRWERG